AKTCDGPLDIEQVRLVRDALVLYMPLPKLTSGKNDHFSTLLTAKNYALCSDNHCLRFSVHTPFFYFPHGVPKERTDNYTDPEPYVLIKKTAERPYDVAIFGVVDPNIGEQIGVLNFAWRNMKDGMSTKVSVEDPAEALEEQLDYFDRWYREYKSQDKEPFKGLKILLAQMSP